MSMVTVGKNGRVYQRAFDHDEARRLRDQGWTYKALAEHFQVSVIAVARVLNPKIRADLDKHNRTFIESQRRPCKGGCGRRVWMHGKVGRARSGYCPTCLGTLRATSVRETTLLCGCCGEWKPDADFYRRTGAISRRGRSFACRPCQTVERRRNRAANPEATREYYRRYRARRRRELEQSHEQSG